MLIGERVRTVVRRFWPVGVALTAAVAAVMIVVLPVLSETPARPAAVPSETPVPGPVRTVPGRPGDVRDGPVTAPYLLSTKASATVYDGRVRVAAPPALLVHLVGRVANGWVLRIVDRLGGRNPVGLLDRAGRFSALSPDSNQVALSPDRTKAVVERRAGESTRLEVVDLATRRPTASIRVAARLVTIHGWNRDGIWYAVQPDQARLAAWQPGSAPRPVPVSGLRELRVAAGSERMLLTSWSGGRWCDRVVTLQDGSLAGIRESCADDEGSRHPALAPDGRTVVHPGDRLAMDVGTGVVTRLTGLTGIADPVARFEDARHLLVVTHLPATSKSAAGQLLNRCDLRSGNCRIVARPSAAYRVGLGPP